MKIKKPIFIVGHERSGTSLLRAIIGSHPEVSIPPNDCNLLRYYDMRSKYGNFETEEEKWLFINDIKSDHKFKCWPMDWAGLETDILSKCQNLKEAYICILRNLWDKSGKTRGALKRPTYEHRIEFLLELFPDSLFIAIIRDPRSIVASQKYYNGKLRKYWKVGFFNTGCIVTGMSWNKSIGKIRSFEKKYGKGQILVLSYETLIKSPVETVKQICDFTSLDFSESMLEFDKQFDFKSNSSFSTNTGNLIYKDSLRKWQKKLTHLEVRLVEYFAENKLVAESYGISDYSMGIIERILFYINIFAAFLYRIAKNTQSLR